jgi:PIN domain nuclease of toxin-antitoxin system
MLVAQATVEGLTLATVDRNIPAYGVSVLAG